MKKPLLLYILLLISTIKAFAQSPYVNVINPGFGPVGTTVTLSGRYFNATAANNIVFFGGVKASIVTASGTSLTVKVPAGATYKPVSVLNTANGLTGYSALPFVVTSDSKSALGAADIDPKVDLTTGYGPKKVCLGDIDGDGKLDMAVLNTSEFSYSVSIYRNVAARGTIITSSFAAKVDIPTGVAPVALALQDMDGDGKPDLMIANKNDNNVSVYHNNSTSGSITAASFGKKIDFATAVSPSDMVIGDIDGDGLPDIIITNGVVISVLRNTLIKGSITSKSFANRFDIQVALSGIALADFDVDGKLDIAGVKNSGEISVLHNQEQIAGVLDKNTFAAGVDFLPGAGAIMVAAADLNNDYKPELITIDRYDNAISVFANATNGNGINNTSFLPKVSFATGPYAFDIAFDDLDGDGRLDIVVPSYSGNFISIYKNTGNGSDISAASFAQRLDITLAQFASSVAIGDIDGDGRPDIAATNDINLVSVFRNNPTNPPVITSVLPLTGPVGTTVTITGTNFSKNGTANNIVYFGGAKAVVKSATATQIVVTVPAGSTYKPISVLNKETGRAASSTQVFTVTYTGNPGIKAVDFEVAPAIYGGNNLYTNVDLSDLDGDGAPDLISASFHGNTLSVAHSVGLIQGHTNSQYDYPLTFDLGSVVNKFQVGDLDGDGKPDITAICDAANKIYVFRNTSTKGNIAFDPAFSINMQQYNYQDDMILADIDADGKMDIVLNSFYSNNFTYFRNTSTAEHLSFTNAYITFENNGGRDLNFCDIDGDGKSDLIYTYYDNSNYYTGMYIARNISAGGKTAFSAGVKVSDFYSGQIKLADFNGDNKMDIVMGGLWVFKNLSVKGVIDSKSMEYPRVLNNSTLATSYAPFNIADIDGDGKPDVVVSNPLNNSHAILAIYRNKSIAPDIAFDPSIDVDVYAQPGNMAIADIDGDGFPDILPALTAGVQPVYYNPQVPVIPPKLTGISQLKGPANTQITITGSGFNTLLSGNTVVIGQISKVVTTTSATSLTVNVPLSSVYDKITLTNNANSRVSNSWEPFVTTFTSKNSISAADFNDPAYIRTNTRDDLIILTDIDGDSKLDLISLIDTNYHHSIMSVYRNMAVKGAPLSAASFAPTIKFNPTDAIAITDIDGDGKPDILNRGGGYYPYNGSFGIYPNTSTPGKPSFGDAIYNGTGSTTLATAVADIDGDGLVDVISTVSNPQYGVTVSPNISRKQPFKFDIEINYKISASPTALAINDMDGDGKPDIITSNDNGTVSVLRNKAIASQISIASFDPEVYIEVNKDKSLLPTLKIGDMDGDGKPDIVFCSSIDSTFCVLRNTSTVGNISFAPKVVFHATQLFRLILADMDGDGKLDIITSQANDYTKPTGFGIFRNISTPGSFSAASLAPVVQVTTGSILNIAAGDLDGDSKPDLVINAGFGVLALFQNNPHVAAKPAISAFGPVQAAQGNVVTIKGTDFSGAKSVSFGGTPATSFSVVSPGLITAVVPGGKSGVVSVTTPLGSGSLAGFTYGPAITQGAVITPLADVVSLNLDNSGNKTIALADIATVTSANANAKITFSPSAFTCANMGSQTIKVKVEDPGAAFNPVAVKFDWPTSLTFDAQGNLYVTDYNNARLRKISANGQVTTMAGNGSMQVADGQGTAAGMPYPMGVAADAFGNLYVGSNALRKINAQGIVSTLAGRPQSDGSSIPGSDISSRLGISGMAISPDGTIYIANSGGNIIMKITQTGVATLFAGVYGPSNQDGTGSQAAFSYPRDITIGYDGNLYVADANNAAIRKITPAGVVTTLKLKGAEAYIYPVAVAAGPSNTLYIVNGNSVALIAADGTVKTIAGNRDAAGAYVDGQGTAARFNAPSDLVLDTKGNIFIADAGNNCIRKIDAAGKVSTFAGGVKGYLDGSIGSAPSTVTAQVKVKVTGSLVINTAFADRLLSLGTDGKATLPNYTNNVSVSGSCGAAKVKITQAPVAGTKINAAEKVTVTITAADSTGGSISKSFNATADANKVIIFNPIPQQVYGTADFVPDVVPPTGSTITFATGNSSVAAVENNKIHITGVGTVTIIATASGLYPGQITSQLVVKPAPLSIAADDKFRYIGQPNPAFTFTYTGFVNGDSKVNMAVQPLAVTIATPSSAAGAYPITLSGATAANYTISYVPGKLTITNNLPPGNFTIAATGATCKGSKNGSISITAAQSLNYTATLTGSVNVSLPFTSNGLINNLRAGTYTLCIGITGQSGYSQCYTVVVTEPKDLSLYTVVSPDKKTVQLSMSGAAEYHISLNGTLYTTRDSAINLPLMTGKNNLSITSDKYCQGDIEKVINVSESILIYPNPFGHSLYINLTNQNPGAVRAEIYSVMGSLVYSGKFNNPPNPLRLDVSGINMAGVYTLKLTMDGSQYTFKIIKK